MFLYTHKIVFNIYWYSCMLQFHLYFMQIFADCDYFFLQSISFSLLLIVNFWPRWVIQLLPPTCQWTQTWVSIQYLSLRLYTFQMALLVDENCINNLSRGLIALRNKRYERKGAVNCKLSEKTGIRKLLFNRF